MLKRTDVEAIPSRNEDLIKAKGGAANTDFTGSKYCMHTGILLCFDWNAFKYAVVFLLEHINIYIQMLSDYMLT